MKLISIIETIVNELFDAKSTFKRNVYGDDENYRSMTKEKAIIWDSKNKVGFQYIFDDVELDGFTFVHLYPYLELRDDFNRWDRSLSDSEKSKIFIDAIRKLPDVLKEYMKKFGNIDKFVFRGRTSQMGRIYSSTSFINFLKSKFGLKYDIKIIDEKDDNFGINTVIMELKQDNIM
jgi:hypothetical protein